jgi:hypothetical protein
MEGTTFTEYVVAQRLARAHRMLIDPRCDGEKISRRMQSSETGLQLKNRPKNASNALIAPVFGKIGSIEAVGFRFLCVLSVGFRAINVPGES